MWQKDLAMILLLFLSCFLQTKEKSNNWTIINNSITINNYASKLTDEQRNNYYYWIGLRNSFYYSDDSNQLEKLVKYFTPEDESYYKNIYNFSIPCLFLSAVVILVFIIYLVRRFIFKGCQGPKIVEKSYHNTTYFCIIFGFLLGLVFLSFTLYNAIQSNSNINKIIDKVMEQKDLMKNIYDEVLYYKNNITRDNFFNLDLSLYGEDIINKDFNELQNKLDNFKKDLNGIQSPKFNFQISSLVLFIIISIFGISGYFVRRDFIPLIASILLLILAAPVFAMGGLETSYTLLSIDFCSTIGNSIISGITPTENQGLGTYLSCPSKDTMRTISTAIYQYILNFDSLHNSTKHNFSDNDFFNRFDIGTDKRNNDYFSELSYNLSNINISTDNPLEREKMEKKRENMLRALDILKKINYILAGLLSMTSCFTAKNSINYIEEFYCYENHGYMLRNIIFSVISGFGFIITAVGINKLIIVMKHRYAKSFRGKKEFNTDINDEDDDDDDD